MISVSTIVLIVGNEIYILWNDNQEGVFGIDRAGLRRVHM